MKIISQYQCEVCNAIYKTEKEALDCEAQIESEKTSSIKIGDEIEFVREIMALGEAMSTYIDSKGVVKGTFIDSFKGVNKGKHTRVFEVLVPKDEQRGLEECVRLVLMEFNTNEGDKFFSPGNPGFEFNPEFYFAMKKQIEESKRQ